MYNYVATYMLHFAKHALYTYVHNILLVQITYVALAKIRQVNLIH